MAAVWSREMASPTASSTVSPSHKYLRPSGPRAIGVLRCAAKCCIVHIRGDMGLPDKTRDGHVSPGVAQRKRVVSSPLACGLALLLVGVSSGVLPAAAVAQVPGCDRSLQS